MNLLDKYIHEVGKHLPRKNRADLEAEIRSILEDMLEDRSQQTGRPVDDELSAELLKEFGSPESVAASYHAPRYLIGPRLYPTFILVTKIVMAAVSGGLLLAFAIGGAFNELQGPGFLANLGEMAAKLLGAVISAFGNLVIVFAILERTIPTFSLEEENKTWDPAELEKEPDPDRVGTGEQIFSILFTIGGLVIFNLYPQVIALSFSTQDGWVMIPMLSKAFFSYLPWINLLLVLQICFSLYLLRQNTWNTPARIANILLDTASVVLAGVMLRGPSLVQLSVEELGKTPLAEAAGVMAAMMQIVPQIVLVVVIVITTIEVVTALYRLIMRRPQKPYIPGA
jgi:hypothetical protein